MAGSGAAGDRRSRRHASELQSLRMPYRGDYAIQALTVLAAVEGRPMTCREIAAAQDIPIGYLRTILRDLLAADLVRSCRGRGGGYLLAHPADEVTLDVVLHSVGVTGTHRLPRPGGNAATVAGRLHALWRVLDATVQSALARITLRDVVHGDLHSNIGD